MNDYILKVLRLILKVSKHGTILATVTFSTNRYTNLTDMVETWSHVELIRYGTYCPVKIRIQETWIKRWAMALPKAHSHPIWNIFTESVLFISQILLASCHLCLVWRIIKIAIYAFVLSKLSDLSACISYSVGLICRKRESWSHNYLKGLSPSVWSNFWLELQIPVFPKFVKNCLGRNKTPRRNKHVHRIKYNISYMIYM